MIQLPYPNLPWPIALAAVHLIAEREQGPRGGAALKSYLCPAKVWTIGWGETDGDKARPGASCSKDQADAWLLEDLTLRTVQVTALLGVHAEPNALGAMVSLAYNIGMAAFAKSTVLRAHNAGDPDSAARAFTLFNKARVNGKLVALPGLTSRRAAEAALYLTPERDGPVDRMPQAVAEESSLASSPISQAGAVTAVAGGASIVSEVSKHVDSLSSVGATLAQVQTTVFGVFGLPPWALPVGLLGLGGVVMWQRHKQRVGGWA